MQAGSDSTDKISPEKQTSLCIRQLNLKEDHCSNEGFSGSLAIISLKRRFHHYRLCRSSWESEQVNTSEDLYLFFFNRRERFVGQSEGKKPRPAARREEPSFERYPKNFSDSRRNEPPPPRNELRETDRREVRGERDERRTVILHDRPEVAHPRHPRETVPNPSRPTSWKSEANMSTEKRESR